MPLYLLKGRSKQSFASSTARENVPGFGVLGSQARRASAMQETLHGERTREELSTCFAEAVVAEHVTERAKEGAHEAPATGLRL